ncbi:MAG TPA: HNH endonuclease [Chloroflexota bacterium]|nr:HNH endonuclease [Chloroflexota bacterium]
MEDKQKNLTGKYLNDLWGVEAKHALYRADGKWYHQLTDFPGALFDANGYIVFETEKDYLESPYLQIKQDLHIADGISSMPNYVRVTEKGQLQVFSKRIRETAEGSAQYQTSKYTSQKPRASKAPPAIDMPQGNEETARVLSQSYRILRDTKVSRWVKYIHGYKCQLCGDTIKLNNGESYAEAHHIQPLNQRHNGPDIVENVICVCPKHHVLLDYGVISLDKSQLHLIPGHDISEVYITYHNTKVHDQS